MVLLFCEKDPEAIKHCIRVNRDLAITLYRDCRAGFGFGDAEEPASASFASISPLSPRGVVTA